MLPSHLAIIRQHCRPLEPVATNVQPVLSRQRDIGCVLFDIYGTLLVSASGEVGGSSEGEPTADAGQAAAMAQALAAVGVRRVSPEPERLDSIPHAAVRCLTETIQRAHQQARRDGVDYPEIDIRCIWLKALRELAQQQLLEQDDEVDIPRLAVEYEMRANPTWPMPGAHQCLRELALRGKQLGTVSNAQFYTELLLAAFFDSTPDQPGFDRRLRFYSYQHKRAKPGRYLYELAERELSRQGVPARNVLYIGNDMLNDVAAAAQVGFRTALFAGDARSLRLRSGDDRVRLVQPDLVVTDLLQLIRCVE